MEIAVAMMNDVEWRTSPSDLPTEESIGISGNHAMNYQGSGLEARFMFLGFLVVIKCIEID